MKIYAHRGASKSFAENTLEAFAEAVRIRADGIELDIHATADGVPVIIHDASLLRTTSVDRNVETLNLAELKMIAPTIPSLAEVLDLVGSSLHFDLEVKQAGIERQVLEVLASHPESRWAISSFDWDVIRAFRSLAQFADLWLLGMTWNQEMASCAAEIGASAVALFAESVSQHTVELVHSSGLQVMVWTVNDAEQFQRLREWGVDMLCTDTPHQFLDE